RHTRFSRDWSSDVCSSDLLLLSGGPKLESALRECLEWGDQFVAEQVDVPTLCPQHFAATGEGPSDLDHAYHEFVALRSASVEEEIGRASCRAREDSAVGVG